MSDKHEATGESSKDAIAGAFGNEDTDSDEMGNDPTCVVSNSGFEAEQDDEDQEDIPSTAFSPINFNVTNRRISDIFASFNDGELDTTPAF
jgi:enamine deaminase RidA (YjgF/YER057c/UK114 family)